ncbi:MAG: hypothetical protein IH944_14505 [Armatimonadetes bacterium]|nr:hypothetical protein [Armatimonadota bacterium]
MRICTRLFVIAAIFGLLTASAWDKVSFDWKPVTGSKANYTTVNKHEVDMGGGVVDLVVTWDSTITVDKVDGKRVWLDIVNEEPDVEIDGSTANHVMVQVPDQTVEHGLDAQYYPESDGEGRGESLGIFSGFRFPKHSLAPGDSYEIGGTKAKFVGAEKVKKWECYKFTFEHRTGKKDDDQWAEGTIWFSTKDLSLVKCTATLHNMDFGMGPEDVENEIVRR